LLGALIGSRFVLQATDVEVQPEARTSVTATPATSTIKPLEPATVPAVLGLRVEIATELLERAGLVVGSVTAIPGEARWVVRTEPTQGEAVTTGTLVDLFVGNGEDG
jgi:beta-lactam-binding protein with PASTA domain